MAAISGNGGFCSRNLWPGSASKDSQPTLSQPVLELRGFDVAHGLERLALALNSAAISMAYMPYIGLDLSTDLCILMAVLGEFISEW